MHYRPDIDGLRAVAVIGVILFHAKLSFAGGYVGVDVFFVISGYLITGSILSDVERGRFSIASFYQRRIRRIAPALLSTIFLTALFAYLFFPAGELMSFGKALVASSFFLSNVYFYRKADYFDPAVENSPLLHTWSLSIEEQFYVVWPLAIAAICRRSRPQALAGAVLVTILLSLAVSEALVNTNPRAGFYLLPGRIWELALGGLLALPASERLAARIPGLVNECISLLGMGAVLVSLLYFNEATPFPGTSAVIPCAGAAAVIATGQRRLTWVGLLLATRPFVFVGRISYSLYLLHWPVLVGAATMTNRPLSPFEATGLLVVSVAAAWFSWRYVEQPFRRAVFPRPAWLIGGCGASLACSFLGLSIIIGQGFPGRGMPNPTWLEEVERESVAFQESVCLAREAALPPSAPCLLGAATGASSTYGAVLWGDSHAAHLAAGLDAAGKRFGFSVREMTKAGCAPLPDLDFIPPNAMHAGCRAFNEAALSAVLADKGVRLVILAARWDSLVQGETLLTADGARTSVERSREIFIGTMKQTVSMLAEHGVKTIVIGQVPIPSYDPLLCLSRSAFKNEPTASCASDRVTVASYVEERVSSYIDRIRTTGSDPDILRPYGLFCDDRLCRLMNDSVPLYMDGSHLSAAGSRLVAEDLGPMVAAHLSSQASR